MKHRDLGTIFDELYTFVMMMFEPEIEGTQKKKERSVSTGMWGFVSQTVQKW